MDKDNLVIDILKNRRSCRSFLNKEIPEDILNSIFEAGLRTASAGNFQPYSIIKVTKEDTKNKLVDLSGDQYYIAKAPVNLVFCLDLRRLKRLSDIKKAPYVADTSFLELWYSLFDTAICAQTMTIAAESYGLRSLYVGNILERPYEIKELLELPDLVIPCMLLAIGYPKTKGNLAKKLRIEDIIHEETYEDPNDDDLKDVFEYKYGKWKMEPTLERLERFKEACDGLDKELTNQCLGEINSTGYINRLQHDFGLFYSPIENINSSKTFMEFIEKSNCRFFDK